MRIGYPEYMEKGYSWNKENNRNSDKWISYVKRLFG